MVGFVLDANIHSQCDVLFRNRLRTVNDAFRRFKWISFVFWVQNTFALFAHQRASAKCCTAKTEEGRRTARTHAKMYININDAKIVADAARVVGCLQYADTNEVRVGFSVAVAGCLSQCTTTSMPMLVVGTFSSSVGRHSYAASTECFAVRIMSRRRRCRLLGESRIRVHNSDKCRNDDGDEDDKVDDDGNDDDHHRRQNIVRSFVCS